VVVDGTSDQFLAGAAGALDQNGAAAFGDLGRRLKILSIRDFC